MGEPAPPEPSRLLRGDAMLADALVCELLEQRLVGMLATHEPDGAIHAVPIWYAAAGEAIVLATASRSRKVANLERDPAATLTLHDSRPGCEVCGACLIGSAEVVTGAAAARLVELVHSRYISVSGLSLTPVAAFLASDDAALRFLPDRAFTWDQRQTDAARALASAGGALPLVPTTPRPRGARPIERLQ